MVRMYRAQQSPTEKYGTIAVVVALHAALAAFVVSQGGISVEAVQDEVLATFDVDVPEPPPPPPVPEPTPQPAQPREEGEAAPKQLESTATLVVAPPVFSPVPIPSPIVAAPVANDGSDGTQGASDVDEGGTGAGGAGNGFGSGGSGSGTGGGGSGEGTRPKFIDATSFTLKAYPKELRRAFPRNAQVLVVVVVQTNGVPKDCEVKRSSGVAAVDSATCNLVLQRVRWQPARDDRGRPIEDYAGYVQRWTGE